MIAAAIAFAALVVVGNVLVVAIGVAVDAEREHTATTLGLALASVGVAVMASIVWFVVAVLRAVLA